MHSDLTQAMCDLFIALDEIRESRGVSVETLTDALDQYDLSDTREKYQDWIREGFFL